MRVLALGGADVLSQAKALSCTGFALAVDEEGRVWSWGEVPHPLPSVSGFRFPVFGFRFSLGFGV